MKVKDAIRNRRSTRAYLDKEVPEEVLHELLDDALWSPSWGSTQCWEIYIAQGEDLNRVRDGLLTSYQKDEALSGDNPVGVDVKNNGAEQVKNRYMVVGKAIFDHLDIERGDSERRELYYHSMYSFFGAPALVVLTLDKEESEDYGLFDLGVITQTILLAAHEKGLGSCIMALTAFHPEVIQDILNINENHKIAVGIALGYPDSGNKINDFTKGRVVKEMGEK